MRDLDLNDVINIAYGVDQKFYGKKSNHNMTKYLAEEVNELAEAVNLNSSYPGHKFEVLQEFGDVLFCLVSFAKQNDIDIASALMLTITKIQERIKHGIDPLAGETE